MKIGIQTGELIKNFGVAKAFAIIKDAGFDVVDLNLDTLTGLAWNELREGAPSPFFSDAQVRATFVREVQEACKATGVAVGQVHSLFPNWFRGLEKANANFREWTRYAIEITKLVGCKTLVVHPLFEGSMRLTPTSREEEWDVNLAFYSSLIPDLKAAGVVCCLENMWGQDWRTKLIYRTVCSDASDAIRYIDELNSLAGERLFGFCLDIGHLTLLGLDTYEAITALGKDRLVALHVHDNRGVDDDHMIPYSGVTIWNRFLRGLREIGYTGNMSFETDGQMRRCPPDFMPQTAKMIAEVGKYFVDCVEKTTETV